MSCSRCCASGWAYRDLVLSRRASLERVLTFFFVVDREEVDRLRKRFMKLDKARHPTTDDTRAVPAGKL